ncbi:trans-aconitate 2-methyltransferase [Saccharopolyspora rhizosphaerae]|uniref:Trans-aconitate 2-methyltransferase n=1 Tax=Saccharopolyspora rhizosphaerae TaxID=2492662 RepID=A0A3R8VK87_9PSEU|nr:trans-aconitate 2-methyltransferase [Saccharopolyspora rhizosphaerae]RRO19270.1 trans-aconitate 2-methyltransferase [Saccharopolyspora rhizosphaerae]
MWDPGTYLTFSDLRDRPAFELIARVRAESPRRVVDLGCGAGNLTGLLTGRWPHARVEALDSSEEMVAEARARGVPALVEDVRDWKPQPDTDVVLCNAVLQWVPGHLELLHRWLPELPSGAWFTFQVPGNFDSPSHVTIRELAAEPRWRGKLDGVLRHSDVVHDPLEYADELADPDLEVDAWEATYVHALRGEDPVLAWVSGTALRPVRAALDDEEWVEFRDELANRLRVAYPKRPDGVTWFPFRRIFVVAHRR